MCSYELLLYSIDALQANVVLVIDHERLFSDLTQEYSRKNVKVVKVTKSGGVCLYEFLFLLSLLLAYYYYFSINIVSFL